MKTLSELGEDQALPEYRDTGYTEMAEAKWVASQTVKRGFINRNRPLNIKNVDGRVMYVKEYDTVKNQYIISWRKP